MGDLILFFPAIAIIYGYIRKDKIGAILIGTVPFILTSSLINPKEFIKEINLLQTGEILYMICPIILPGIMGYFAARRRPLSLLIAIFLHILWFMIIFLGID